MSDKRGWRKRGKGKKGANSGIEIGNQVAGGGYSSGVVGLSKGLEDIQEVKKEVTENSSPHQNGELVVNKGVVTLYQHSPQHQGNSQQGNPTQNQVNPTQNQMNTAYYQQGNCSHHQRPMQQPPPLPLPVNSPTLKQQPPSPTSPRNIPPNSPSSKFQQNSPPSPRRQQPYSRYTSSSPSRPLPNSPPSRQQPNSPPSSRHPPYRTSRHPPNTPPPSRPGQSQPPTSSPPCSPREPGNPVAIPQLPKLNPPPGSLPVSRSSNFVVKADIESPPGANVKSWPGSPVRDRDKSPHTNNHSSAHQQTSKGDHTSADNINGSVHKHNKVNDCHVVSPVAEKVNNNTPVVSDINTMPATIDGGGQKKGGGGSKLSRKPSLNLSKSDEALSTVRIHKPAEPLSPMTTSQPNGRQRDDKLNASFDSSHKRSSPFSTRSVTENKLGRGSGNESPGSESVASLMSQATVITQTAGPLDSPHARGAQKHTLGEILKHIDLKSQSLLERDDFVHATTLPDLTFLAHQSRYNADPQIKRRLMSRLADCKIVDLFLRVFQSVHTVDYLQTVDPPLAGDGRPPHPTRMNLHGDESPRVHADSPRSRPLDMMSEPGVDARSMLNERLHNVPHSMKNLRAVLTLLVNCSDKSASVCEQCIHSPLVPLLLEELSQPHFHGTDAMRDQNRMYLVKGYLGILLNVIKQQPDSRDMYRESGVVKVLQQYLKSSLLMVKTRTLLLLSYVIGEAENDVINSSERHLGLLVKMLQGALESEGHFSKKYGIGAAELASAINRYASCESNKVRLLRRGILSLYNQLISASSSDEEKMLGAKGLWSLAFSEENRGVIQGDEQCLQALEQLEIDSHREEIRKTASGALWVIREHHIPVRPVGSEYSSDPDISQHVLISYQWGAKSLVFKIKERLKAAGYKVCTDVENTDVPIMDGMAAAVSQAAVVLLCLTHRFKESPSCRTEAEYAWHGGRPLIPIKLQPHYSPEGWLLPLVDARLTFDLSSDDNLDTLLPNLIRDIGNRGRVRAIEQFDALLGASSSSLPKSQDVATQTLHVRDTAEGWSCDDVNRWLKSNELSHLSDKLKHVNGELLLEIRKMQKEAPESFYSTLKNELKLNFLSVLKFTRALDNL